MSWATVFPILTDEHVEAYEAGVSKKDRKLYEDYFEVKRIVNPRRVRHIISTSLFWKNIRMSEPEIVVKNRASLMNAGKRKTLLRFDPWKHYVEPLLLGARKLQQTRPDVAFCVHLAADLEFLIPDLVEVGCEVRLMKTSSIRHNPGAMWRFLPLEETGRWITVLDADSAGNPEPHLDRTVEAARMNLGWWRVPVWGELNEIGNLNYRPLVACHFGTVKQIPAKQLMQALVWHSQNGTIETKAQLPGCRAAPVHGTVWPDYGFDEWWLTAALYPRAAMDGLLTFVPASAKSRLLPLDIEYASWAHPDSELVYFGSAGGGCCGPLVEHVPDSDPELSAENTKVGPVHTALKRIDQTKLIPLNGFTETHPLPPQALRDKVLGKAAVDPEVQAWFNPAGLVWRGKRWIAYRTESVPIWRWGRISLAQVSEKFGCIPKTNRLLSLPTGFGEWCAEDPRLFTYKNRMYLYYTDHYYAGLAEISPSGRVIQAKLFPAEQRGALPHPDRHDKNWGFFESEGKLYAVYWTQPHIVREVNLKSWKFGKEWKTEWECPVPGGELHGGSSPIFHDGLLWRVVHYNQAPPTNEWGRKYFLWLMAFEPVPPFAPVLFSNRPLLMGEGSSEIASLQGRDWQVVFCASMERLAKGWRLLLGHNDRRMRVAEISDRELRPHMVKIGRRPIFFFHVHKAAGTTFINLAQKNGHKFVKPNSNALPALDTVMAATSEPFNMGPELSWEFWNESPAKVKRTIRRWLEAGVDFVAQEFGHFEAALWEGFLTVVSLRHPIDRLYSHYLQHRDGEDLSAFRSFEHWVSSLQPAQWEANPLLMHFGRGDVEVALGTLQKFGVILNVDDYQASMEQMRRFGWNETDTETNFKSWTDRSLISGRAYASKKPSLLRALQVLMAPDLQLYDSILKVRSVK